MQRVFVLIIFLVLSACSATPVKDVNNIRTKTLLDKSLHPPFDISAVYYVSKKKPEAKKVNFWELLEESIDLVAPTYFRETKKLSEDSSAQLIFLYETEANWNYSRGSWTVALTMNVQTPDGALVYKTSNSKTTSGAGPYDFDAVYNSLAKAVKEAFIHYLNNTGKEQLASLQLKEPGSIKARSVLANEKPKSSGSGFFFADDGAILTAAHVVKDCIFLEGQYKGKKYPARKITASNLLDLAVVTIDTDKYKTVAINPEKNGLHLGQQIFATGYPLTDLLSPYPSLTVGNISSMGGLKGGKGYFQFTAPIQPGNSGGPIVDYKGNLVGLVSSTLNQSLLLGNL